MHLSFDTEFVRYMKCMLFVFQASPDTQVFYTSLEALVQLSEVVCSALNPHLKALLPQVTLKTLNVL